MRFLILTLAVTTAACAKPTDQAIVLRGVTLIDGKGGDPQRNRTIVVQQGRITAIGDDDLDVPRRSRVVVARDKYVIPGLCDAHVHFSYGVAAFERFVANGVTCVREMWGDTRQTAAWKAQVDSGQLLGPVILDISAGFADGNQEPFSPLLDSARNKGATFIKIGDVLPRQRLEELLIEARSRNLAVLGHLPYSTSAIDAARLGQRSIEHANRLLFDAALSGDSLRPIMEAAQTRDTRFNINAAVIARFDTTLARRLARDLAATGIALSPTLISARKLAFRNDSSFDADVRLRHIPDTIRARWRRQTAEGKLSTSQLATARAMYDRQRELVRVLHQAGVPILAGSDAGDTWVYDGSSLADELVELVQAGLSPMESLLAATRNVARISRAEDRVGTIEVGRIADLVLLDADPVSDIANVRRIYAVVRAGRLIERRELDAILRQA